MADRGRASSAPWSKRFPGRAAPWLAAGVLAAAGWLHGPVYARAAADEPAPEGGSARYDSKGRRDPFSPLVRDGRLVGIVQTHAVQTSRPVLYGILWDAGGQSIALINDVEVKVGDTVGTYRVVEIRKDAVVLSDGREPVVLQLAFEPGAPGQAPAP
jgi:hypothetical protein